MEEQMSDEWFEGVKTNLNAFCELFPAAFAAAPFETHRPLALGIDKKLVELGVLSEAEAKAALRYYVRRVMYNKSCVAGAPRIDLDGNVAGFVSEEEAECSRGRLLEVLRKRDAQADSLRSARQVACDARREERRSEEWATAIAKARQDRLEKEAKAAERQAAKAVAESKFAAPEVPAPRSGDGLSGLRQAAARRKAEILFRAAS
jgi:sRNA-binding protein